MSIAAVHYDAFFSEVEQTGIIWSIKDDQGFPAPLTHDGRRAMPFWSSESRAIRIINTVEVYRNFTLVAITWEIFKERWIPGLIKDGLLAGINWSGDRASGFDIEPAVLQNIFDSRTSP